MKKTLLALALVAAALVVPGQALADDGERVFPDTGYQVTDDAIWTFFNAHGGEATFGPPISREMSLQGLQVQLFQNAALQVLPDGSVQPVQLTGDGWLPYRSFDGLTVPPADPATAFVTPTPDQPNYAARLKAFLAATVAPPFADAYDSAVLGVPTSGARQDPNNPNFVYQRFANGILMADSASGSVGLLPLGQYVKDVARASKLPSDVTSEAASSPLYGHYSADEAFVPDAG